MFTAYAIDYLGYKGDRHILAKTFKSLVKSNREQLYPIVDSMALEFCKDILDRRISLPPIHYQIRYDEVSNKYRDIGIASIKQQVFDYITVRCCEKMFMNKIGRYQCASLPKRGCHYGMRAIKRWLRNDNKTKYAFKCDVRKYYPSVNQERLLQLLKRDIKNDDVIYLLEFLISTYKEGICIGSYLSQYLANYYLSYAYRHIEHEMYRLTKSRRGKPPERVRLVTHHLFYMDDIIMFGSNLKDLTRASKMLESYLNEELDLELKDNKRLFRVTDDTLIDMMGFKIGRNHVIIRKKICDKIKRISRKYKGSKVANMTLKDAHRLISYNGYVKYTDSYNLRRKYKFDESVKRAKEMISDADRKSNIHRATT